MKIYISTEIEAEFHNSYIEINIPLIVDFDDERVEVMCKCEKRVDPSFEFVTSKTLTDDEEEELMSMLEESNIISSIIKDIT